MHALDSADSAGGLYVAGPPRTVIGRHYLNAIGREIIGAILAAGITLRASGAADAAASYTGQLLEAIRVLGWKAVTSTYTMTSSPSTLSPNTAVAAYLIAESTSLPDGVLYIDSDPVNETQVIVVMNTTASSKTLLSVDDSFICTLGPGRAATLFARDEGGDILWTCASPHVAQKTTFSTEIYEGGGLATASADFDVEAVVDLNTRTTVLSFPASATIAISATGPFSYAILLFGAPSSFLPKTLNTRFPILLENDAGVELGYLQPVATHFEIRKADGTNFASASATTVYFPSGMSFIHR